MPLAAARETAAPGPDLGAKDQQRNVLAAVVGRGSGGVAAVVGREDGDIVFEVSDALDTGRAKRFELRLKIPG